MRERVAVRLRKREGQNKFGSWQSHNRLREGGRGRTTFQRLCPLPLRRTSSSSTSTSSSPTKNAPMEKIHKRDALCRHETSDRRVGGNSSIDLRTPAEKKRRKRGPLSLSQSLSGFFDSCERWPETEGAAKEARVHSFRSSRSSILSILISIEGHTDKFFVSQLPSFFSRSDLSSLEA